jgi:hypothetical protein
MLMFVRPGFETGLQILNVKMLVFEGGLHLGTDSTPVTHNNGDDVSLLPLRLYVKSIDV